MVNSAAYFKGYSSYVYNNNYKSTMYYENYDTEEKSASLTCIEGRARKTTVNLRLDNATYEGGLSTALTPSDLQGLEVKLKKLTDDEQSKQVLRQGYSHLYQDTRAVVDATPDQLDNFIYYETNQLFGKANKQSGVSIANTMNNPKVDFRTLNGMMLFEIAFSIEINNPAAGFYIIEFSSDYQHNNVALQLSKFRGDRTIEWVSQVKVKNGSLTIQKENKEGFMSDPKTNPRYYVPILQEIKAALESERVNRLIGNSRSKLDNQGVLDARAFIDSVTAGLQRQGRM